ncbi:tetratricopeptide repeat protein [Aliikangiella sp. G2MR2-5]|uniref:tetratricopeptide repeat protein n=1 Tax=Aliikangiella sp. G2MR2-5 TaxID=2788943 RepID=UPI0018AA3554|nr:tetratricopeptide repeat protein [Aliikangiella sp. G2MR2-5]
MTVKVNDILKTIAIVLSLSFLLPGCTTQAVRKTLADLDKISRVEQAEENQAPTQEHSREKARLAYWKYLDNTSRSDTSRQIALTRLAQLEFEISNEQENASASAGENHTAPTPKRNQAHEENQINKVIELYETSLKDYPNAKGNDRILYQLAKALDQIGNTDASIENLKKLSSRYSKSPYYAEAQFRIGENHFSRAEYSKAEIAYTEVILNPVNQIFLEKALFKRGWSRFKLSFYDEAIDDFIATVQLHNFSVPEKQTKTEKEQFDEYFRAIGLSFANLGGADFIYEYFSRHGDFPHIFHTYSVISDIYLKQERYSDAVKILESYRNFYPEDKNYPMAQFKVVQIWQQSGFKKNLFSAIERFYSLFNPANKYWLRVESGKIKYNQISFALKNYILLTAEHFHSRYQQNKSNLDMQSAKIWYNRYLKHYKDTALSEGVYFRYAELLRSSGDLKSSLSYYEKAAFDGELVLNKDSAYQTLAISNNLYHRASGVNKSIFLKKQLTYAPLFIQMYSNDQRSDDIAVNTAQLAYENKLFSKTIDITSLPLKAVTKENQLKIDILKAQSHFHLNQYESSESAYSALLNRTQLSSKNRVDFSNRLALAIYSQGKEMKALGRVDDAINHFMRISVVTADNEIAATGMYDAIAMLMENNRWNDAVEAIRQFQSLYPKHKFNGEVTKKLSLAYLKLEKKDKAAEQFEKISDFEKNKEVKMAALWQAAELYSSQDKHLSAARSLSKYANSYKKPFDQYMEALHRLIEIYQKLGNKKLLNTWRNRILKADKNASPSEKTDRTRYIAAITLLELAKEQKVRFSSQKLSIPLNKSLKTKKATMQKAVEYYGKASSYGIPDVTTESTYGIALLYADFSQALLNSERPTNLNDDELEQYNVLLEDQAYPFEDKAIEFHEINLSRINTGIFDQWIALSLSELKSLFPTKYARKSKIDGFIQTSK